MPRTLLDCLVERFPAAKKQTLKRMAAGGRVLVNDRVVRRLDVSVGESDRLTVLDRPPAGEATGPARPAGPRLPAVDVVYEDADLLVVNKPAGVLTSTTPKEWRPTLLA